MPLSQLATMFAGASRVFNRHRLDFCCGGAKSLQDACEAAGIDVSRVMSELRSEMPTEPHERWDHRPLHELIDHLLANFHEAHRAEVPRLIEMAKKVEAVHGERDDCPRGLHSHLVKIGAEMESHMQKEEQILFPLIRDGRGAMAQAPVQVMEMEHEEHAANLRRTRELTADLTPPADACGTWRALYLGLLEFEAELMRHVHLENYVLFPRAINESSR